MEQLILGDVIVDVMQKDIQNIHLSVYPPTGKVRIAAPLRMNLDTIRIYTISKLDWIKKQQQKFKAQEREAPREYLDKESHYFLGNRYQLKVVHYEGPARVEIAHKTIKLHVRPYADTSKLQAIMEGWYRAELKKVVGPMIAKWQLDIGVTLDEFVIRKMKTKWGTCNREAKRIWLNLELAKKPIHCIEYIVVHELVHLLERNHNERFVAYMNNFLPEWRHLKSELNKLPVSHVDWGY